MHIVEILHHHVTLGIEISLSAGIFLLKHHNAIDTSNSKQANNK